MGFVVGKSDDLFRGVFFYKILPEIISKINTRCEFVYLAYD